MSKISIVLITVFASISIAAHGQNIGKDVNVFLGTSGDHGQLSPGASYPFGLVDIAPQTYPNIHTGYEHQAKLFLGFTHNRLEGVGCQGSGGNLLIKPFIGDNPERCQLIKTSESSLPGFYQAGFKNGIRAAFAAEGKAAVEQYHFPAGKHSFYLDLSHALTNRFIAEQHQVQGNAVSGWIESGTTCRVGAYRVYYYLVFDQAVQWRDSTAHSLVAIMNDQDQNVTIRVAFSSVSAAYAKASINQKSFEQVKAGSLAAWGKELRGVKVAGDPEETKLFYSLLYRTMQAPYDITEPDGSYRANDGSLQHTSRKAYNGWAIWDNYRTVLPLLSLVEPGRYQDIVTSIANLYRFGKKDWATKTEPSNTVRTEHAIVVLLDAYRKGYMVDFKSIRDSMFKETEKLDFSHPDKALESSYDTWAFSQILFILKEDSLAKKYLAKAGEWNRHWQHDFKDVTKKDVDELSVRKMYQGTIWQYRWFVPFDIRGLIEQCGGDMAYTRQLDEFFSKDYYNAANEPDIQVPYLYNTTAQPWKSQAMIRHYARDTVVQYYYDDNYRGIDPTIDRIFNNRPGAFIRSMDDDMGAMSAWYVLAACGISPACPGWPVYYLHVPLFKTVQFNNAHPFTIRVLHSGKYIRSATLNGMPLKRNWLTQKEIATGGTLVINAGSKPNKTWGINNQFITAIDKTE